MQTQISETNPSAPSAAASIVAVVKRHLATRPWYTFRGFRFALADILKHNDIARCDLDTALNALLDDDDAVGFIGTTSRALTNARPGSVHRLAAALGYAGSTDDISAVFKPAKQMEAA